MGLLSEHTNTADLNLPIARPPEPRIWHIVADRATDLTFCGLKLKPDWYIIEPGPFGGDKNECMDCVIGFNAKLNEYFEEPSA